MTRKDYVLIANAVNLAKDQAAPAERNQIYWTAHFIANALRRDNPRFEKARFMEACGFPASE